MAQGKDFLMSLGLSATILTLCFARVPAHSTYLTSMRDMSEDRWLSAEDASVFLHLKTATDLPSVEHQMTTGRYLGFPKLIGAVYKAASHVFLQVDPSNVTQVAVVEEILNVTCTRQLNEANHDDAHGRFVQLEMLFVRSGLKFWWMCAFELNRAVPGQRLVCTRADTGRFTATVDFSANLTSTCTPRTLAANVPAYGELEEIGINGTGAVFVGEGVLFEDGALTEGR